MGSVPPPPTDDEFDRTLALVLRTGVLISAALVAFGGVVYLAGQGFLRPDYGVFKGAPEGLRSVQGIVSNVTAMRGAGLIQFGVLLLIATPIARVVFSVVGFARQRDGLYVGLTLLVLSLLAYGLTTG